MEMSKNTRRSLALGLSSKPYPNISIDGIISTPDHVRSGFAASARAERTLVAPRATRFSTSAVARCSSRRAAAREKNNSCAKPRTAQYTPVRAAPFLLQTAVLATLPVADPRTRGWMMHGIKIAAPHGRKSNFDTRERAKLRQQRYDRSNE